MERDIFFIKKKILKFKKCEMQECYGMFINIHIYDDEGHDPCEDTRRNKRINYSLIKF